MLKNNEITLKADYSSKLLNVGAFKWNFWLFSQWKYSISTFLTISLSSKTFDIWEISKLRVIKVSLFHNTFMNISFDIIIQYGKGYLEKFYSFIPPPFKENELLV